jgi:hypothetical protein
MSEFYPDSDQIIDDAVAYALRQVGKPYSFSASPESSWDCTKLTTWAYSKASGGQGYSGGRIQLTPYSYVQAQEVRKLSVNAGSTNGLQKGDLLFFFVGDAHHASMYIGDGQIVEASSPAIGVRTTTVWNSWNSTYFSWAGRPHKIGPYGGNPGTGDKEGSNDKEDVITKVAARKISKNALAVSKVAGTPQSARFAVMNMANESLYLTQDKVDIISKSEFYIKAKALVLGDQYEIKRDIDGGKSSYEITIDSDFIQSKATAEAIASMAANSLENSIKSINVEIFGNPLIQIGDIVKFNYFTGKIESGSKDFYIVSRVQNTFSGSLSTSLTLTPLNKIVSVV